MAQKLLFLDTECLGTQPHHATWEIAWRQPLSMVGDSTEVRHDYKWSFFVQHDPEARDPDLPQSFVDDYEKRFDPEAAIPMKEVLERLARFAKDRALVLGSNPSFDMTRLEAAAEKEGIELGWHYHGIDVPAMAHGWLLGRGVQPAQPWRSDFLSQACGVDPAAFDRHTAMGDCLWTRALWNRITS